jgi:leucyl aminopeptidase
MKIKLSNSQNYPTLIVFVHQGENTAVQDFLGKSGETTVRYDKSSTIIYCGLGEKTSFTASDLRIASAKGSQRAIELKRDKISLLIPKISNGIEISKAVIEGVILGSYKFSTYKSEKPFQISQIELIDSELNASSVKTITSVCESVLYARNLVNENASLITPEYLANETRSLSSIEGFKVHILDEKDLRKQNLNLISLVGQASTTPPRLAVIEYNGNSRSKEKTAIVGKGVTFDSGGQNHKPTGSIETMRTDMAGAAAVLGVMKSLAVLRPKINVLGVIPAAHNAIGGNAYFPGDIYSSYSGKTVEIWSTDAEGRLILADAISYCQDKFKPTCIIDLATLTGGVLYALGDFVAALFSNDDKLANDLFIAGERTGERMWRLPLYKEYCESVKGEMGDLRNVSKLKKGYASSITGAAFIKEFVNNNTPWAHLDIAGTAYNEGQSHGEVPMYATGFGVRLLLDYLLAEHKK